MKGLNLVYLTCFGSAFITIKMGMNIPALGPTVIPHVQIQTTENNE